MMREWIFTLSQPVDGIETLAFFAPSYGKGRSFAVKVERAFMALAKEKAKEGVSAPQEVDPDADPEAWKDSITDAQLAALLTSGDDGEKLLDSFVECASASAMCKAGGAPVAKAVFEAMAYADVKAAFGGYVKRFLL